MVIRWARSANSGSQLLAAQEARPHKDQRCVPNPVSSSTGLSVPITLGRFHRPQGFRSKERSGPKIDPPPRAAPIMDHTTNVVGSTKYSNPTTSGMRIKDSD